MILITRVKGNTRENYSTQGQACCGQLTLLYHMSIFTFTYLYNTAVKRKIKKTKKQIAMLLTCLSPKNTASSLSEVYLSFSSDPFADFVASRHSHEEG